jgi:hypothetical protein
MFLSSFLSSIIKIPLIGNQNIYIESIAKGCSYIVMSFSGHPKGDENYGDYKE